MGVFTSWGMSLYLGISSCSKGSADPFGAAGDLLVLDLAIQNEQVYPTF